MRIGMIGADYVARALTGLATRFGHQVMLSNSRGPRTLYTATAMLNCAAGTVSEAIEFGEMIVIAIPFYAYENLPHAAWDGRLESLQATITRPETARSRSSMSDGRRRARCLRIEFQAQRSLSRSTPYWRRISKSSHARERMIRVGHFRLPAMTRGRKRRFLNCMRIVVSMSLTLGPFPRGALRA